MKYLTIVTMYFVFLLLQTDLYAQPKTLLAAHSNPEVKFDYDGNIICAAIDVSSRYNPVIAQKVDRKLRFLWPNEEYGVGIFRPLTENEIVIGAKILPQKDGSVFFAGIHSKFIEIRETEYEIIEIFRKYPILQLVDAEGNRKWGDTGICLSDTNFIFIDNCGYVIFHNFSFDAEGNVVVIWTLEGAENEAQNKIIEGTFMQKVNPETGEILLAPGGNKILDKDAFLTFEMKDNRIFYLCPPDGGNEHKNFICTDKNGNIQWSVDWFENILGSSCITASVDANGDIYLVYASDDNNIRGCKITADGEIQNKDQLIISDSNKISLWSPLIGWGEDNWILLSDNKLYNFTSEGTHNWDENGIRLNPTKNLYSVGFDLLFDNQCFWVTYVPVRDSLSDDLKLKIQKISQSGELLLNEDGIDLIYDWNGSARILPDGKDGAYVICDAFPTDEPEFQVRGTLIMRLDENGQFSQEVGVPISRRENRPDNFLIVDTFPNPFSDCTRFLIQTRENTKSIPTGLIIYNILGKEVMHYNLKEEIQKSTVELTWDGKDRYGQKVCPGVYFFQIVGGDSKRLGSGKLLLL